MSPAEPVRDPTAPDPAHYVRDHTVYACVTGSRAQGLATPASDTDLRGIFLAPTPAYWRFEKPPTHVQGPGPEQLSWELERACALALRGDPNVVEALNSPLVLGAEPVGAELLALRDAFLSHALLEALTRYAHRQGRKLAADLRGHGAPRWKHAMHLLRLLLTARELLRTGRYVVDMTPYREELLAVRRGETTWESWSGRVERLLSATETTAHRARLPAEPDHARVEDFLVRVRRASASGSP
ncbi:nucleotidyltransferase domain-containing protein [Streptomyces sp. P6-2-1]|uniref:nucleotidyltransferase domain-containing protein n=1 Tax=unclassified Streptomyces TaxID=2593676 RepID=UPI003D36A16F